HATRKLHPARTRRPATPNAHPAQPRSDRPAFANASAIVGGESVVVGTTRSMHTQAALIAFAGMFGAAVSALYFGIKATLNRQPGVPYFPGNFQSPFNILFRPEQLT